MNQYPPSTLSARSESVVRSFIGRTYSWMTAGLALTAAIAYFVGRNPDLMVSIGRSGFLLPLVQLGIVMFLSFLAPRVSATVAGLLFMAYSAVTGLTFGVIFQFYTASDVTAAFLTTAGTFGAMSAFGFLTRRNLAPMGTFLMFALIGLIIASIVNIFIGGSTLNLIISAVGVLLFAGLTAYDTQMLRNMALQGFGDAHTQEKGAIYGALTLYLNFINMFLFILRLFSSRD
ncbi:Bax inhibitor-1/YccA family protein [Deinococcus maricopensis]|uniref:Bax inhibitor-1/YccA family protein n=1 Tax=Deinococcus maricopensis (strain DSM 21211 / LMG 22137 / NRRL B-23946 / LB-34) TaxID=709986 RepID=E8U8R2_DEIML|nr:Bax inhibitor-1/YccA family protein [Deinococcus maricopensis]ADV67451.1 protein of unknown function UPF0005 [Deinococcus maricopensis DSM 21211]